jgi:prephenate dehydrogenase
LGASVTLLNPELHDHYVAEISHLPHLLAAALVNHASEEARALAAGGFRDTTRVASGSPELWAEILLANREAVSTSLALLLANLVQTHDSIQKGDKTKLLKLLQQAQHSRSQLLENEKKPRPNKRS